MLTKPFYTQANNEQASIHAHINKATYSESHCSFNAMLELKDRQCWGIFLMTISSVTCVS